MRLTILFLFFSTLCASAQVTLDWQKSYGGSYGDWANSIKQTTDGGYIMAGYSSSNNGDVSGHHGSTVFSYDFWVVKLQANGTLDWQKSLGGSDDEVARCVAQTTDGGYIVAGYAASNDGDVTGNKGSNDFWIVKLNATGAIQWQRCYGGSNDDQAYSIQQTSDGGYIACGTSYSNDSDLTMNYGNYDYWIVKLTANGAIEWQTSMGGFNDDEAFDIRQTNDGGYIVIGASNSNDFDVTDNNGQYDYWIIKLDGSGNIIWKKSYGGSGEDYGFAIYPTQDGGYIAAGYASSNDSDVTGNHGVADYWIIKLQSDGTLEWQKSFGGSNDDESYSIQQTADGGYIVGGYAFGVSGDITGNHGAYDYWIVKLTADGEISWQRSLGGSSSEFVHSIQQTSDGGYIIAGWSSSNDGDVSGNHGNEDCWVVKVSETVGIEDHNPVLSLNIFPNPVSDYLIISNTREERADFYLCDEQGRLIKALPGIRNETIHISNLAAGAYFLKAKGNHGWITQKIIKQ